MKTDLVNFKGIYGSARIKDTNDERKIYFPEDNSTLEINGSQKDGFTIKKVSDQKFDKIHIYNVDNTSVLLLGQSAKVFINTLGYHGSIIQYDNSESDIVTVHPRSTLWLKDRSSTYSRSCNGLVKLNDSCEAEIHYLKSRARLSLKDISKASVDKAHERATIENDNGKLEILEKVHD